MPRLNIKGQGLVEYILLVVLMAVLAIGAVKLFGGKVQNGFSKAGSALDKEFNGI